jgi:hypothetical protein
MISILGVPRTRLGSRRFSFEVDFFIVLSHTWSFYSTSSEAPLTGIYFWPGNYSPLNSPQTRL